MWRKSTNVSLFCLAALLTIGPQPAFNFAGGPPGNGEPAPLPGFINLGFGPDIHAFFPGFTPDDPIDHEPSAITNFRGFTALAYHLGTATDSDSNEYDLFTDMRVFQGEYVALDGTHHRGTFVLI